ncbi:cuticle protein 7-like isoform X3 [Eriocheir sinensis]|uniref:cuticle protein 7-like isoform X3 n=1 Tax=Eriocheir sinensis TaxID=95602 RepID=UPI0021C6B811|nr:cuticle protein 7-like isoform X3 [Eriocheir sinensis]
MSSLKVVAAVLALVAAGAARPDHGAGAPPPPPATYGAPPPTSYGQPEPENAPPKYEFNWEVKDQDSGNDFGQQESRDGDNTEGSYYVLLPDGRIQKVTYTVTKDGGYLATVEFEGETKQEHTGYGESSPPPQTYGPPTTPPAQTYGPPTTPPATYGLPTTPPATYGPPTTPPSIYGPPTPPPTTYGQPAAPGHA